MQIKDIYINYIEYGNKKGKPVVLLHGWGQNIEMMDPIGRGLEKDYRIIILDLPGFGKSGEPKSNYTLYDYYDILCEFLDKLKVKNPILVGHSFGGRLAIIYGAKRKVEKLVLLAAPFKRSAEKDNLKVKILKLAKTIPFTEKVKAYAKNKIGSSDYKDASPVMKTVLVNTVNEDLTEYLKQITAPTILIWGDLDEAVSVEDAKEAEKIMKDADL